MSKAIKLYFDGGCRPNPGPIETMVAARGETYHRAGIGEGDNNDAEWEALLAALAVARELDLDEVVLIGDSALVVGQARGTARSGAPRFAAYLARFDAAAEGFASVRVRQVARSHNLAGIALERLRAGL